MDAAAEGPLDRLAVALERLSSANLALSDASERLAASAEGRAHDEFAAAAASSRRAAREAAAASARAASAT